MSDLFQPASPACSLSSARSTSRAIMSRTPRHPATAARTSTSQNVRLRSSPSGYVGSGVSVESVTRSYDELLAGQVALRRAATPAGTRSPTQAAQIDNMLSDSTTGITASLQSFVNSLQNVANSPASTAQRQVALSQAQALAQQLQNYNQQLTTSAPASSRRSRATSVRSTRWRAASRTSTARSRKGSPPPGRRPTISWISATA